MTDISADFNLEPEVSLTADFELNPNPSMEVSYRLNTFENDHTQLINRDVSGQHPISAITGLRDELDSISEDITLVEDNLTQSITDEKDRAELAEGNLSDAISDESTARQNADNTLTANLANEVNARISADTSLTTLLGATNQTLNTHIADVNNPHQVTKTQIGLGNVDNTSDMDKPISSAVQSALAGKVSDVKVNNVSVVTNNVANVDLSGYVTTNTGQTISGAKTFSNTLTMAGQTPIAASHNYNSYAVFQRLPNTREQIFSNGGDKLRLRGSETRPQYNGNDLALVSDIAAAALSAGTGIDITSGVVSVTAPTVINNATGTNSIALGDSSQSTAEGAVALGKSSKANSTYSTAIGYNAQATNTNSVVIGKQAKATAARTVAIGSGAEANANDAYVIKGINNTANTFQVGSYTLLNTSTGLIPDARISSTFATTSYVDDSVSTNTAYFDGSWDTYADIPSTVAGFTNENLPEPTNNNYLVVLEDETQDGGTWRYKYVDNGLGYDKANWSVEYEVNETPFTQAQLDAINSGVTSADVSLAQSALQSGDNISELVNDSGYITGITSSDVTTALGYTPYNSTNPNGYITSSALSGYATETWVGNQGYITGITSSDVTTALGYTPYNSTNPDGYISGITSGDVTTALGYTPYDASNPSGYTSNVGTVTSVNNTSPDGSGNVTITIPNPLPSQTGNSGKFLTTDGTDPSWAAVDALPSQTGQSGKFLTTDGTDASWASVDALPSQTGHSGDVLTTDGTDASWVDTDTIYPVVETYVNGTEWYRVYSDGWVEQGGQDVASATGDHTITLLKPFADSNYIVTSSSYGVAGVVNLNNGQAVGNKTATTFQYYCYATGSGNGGYNLMWMACGYGA